MMVIAVGLSSYNIALFHLMNHAFYKALLFLGAGSVIHAVSDNQDFRKYGGLRPFLPLTYSVMLIASLSLVAFPFMTGFYSKDLILESAYGQHYFSSTVVYVISTIGAIFTTLYSVKVLFLTFLTNPNGPLINYKKAHEGDIFMSLPLKILAVFSIFIGYIIKDMFIGLGSGFFSDNSIFIHPYHEIMLDTEFGVPILFKLLPFVFTALFSFISILLFEYLSIILIYFKLSRLGYNIFSFFNQRFLIELFYNRFITSVVLMLGGQTSKILDKGYVEYLGPHGLKKGILNISKNIARLNTGVITSYALYILVSLVFYMMLYAYLNNVALVTFVFIFLVLYGNYHNSNLFIESNIGKSFILFFSNTLHRIYYSIITINRRDSIFIVIRIIIFTYFRRPISDMLYSLMPEYLALTLALIIGCIINYCINYIKKTSPIFNNPILNNYICLDLVNILDKFNPYVWLVISPTVSLLVAKKIQEMETSGFSNAFESQMKLLNQKNNIRMAQKIEVIGGAMKRDGSDSKHNELGDVFLEYNSDKTRYVKKLYIDGYMSAREREVEKMAFNTLVQTNNPFYYRAYGGFTIGVETTEIRNIWWSLW